MKEYIAFIDETGDPDFNESASKLFFMGAVVFNKENENGIYDDLRNIKQRHGLVELKSSKIRSFKRRLTQKIVKRQRT